MVFIQYISIDRSIEASVVKAKTFTIRGLENQIRYIVEDNQIVLPNIKLPD